jgi:hypothetical protein
MAFHFRVSLLLLVLVCTSASGDAILVDTFGPGNAFNSLEGDHNRMNSVGLPFTTSVSGTVAFAEIAASGLNTFTTPVSGALSFEIVSDSSGLPGSTILDTLTFQGVSTPGIYLAPSTLFPTLQAGTQYWLVMEAAADPNVFFGIWQVTSPPLFGSVAFNPDNSGWFVTQGFGVPAVLIASTPEPRQGGPVALFLAGLAWHHFGSRKGRVRAPSLT